LVTGAVGMDVPRRRYYANELDLRISRSYGPGRYDPSYEEHGLDYPLPYARWTEQRNMQEFLQTKRTLMVVGTCHCPIPVMFPKMPF